MLSKWRRDRGEVAALQTSARLRITLIAMLAEPCRQSRRAAKGTDYFIDSHAPNLAI